MDVQSWISAFTKPKEVFPAAKASASVKDGAINFALAGFLYGLLTTLQTQLLGSFLVPATGLNPLALLVSAISMAILLPIGSIIAHAVIGFIAKHLGGTGSWKEHFYLLSLVAVPVYVLMGVLNVIPFIGGILNLAVSLYMLYLLTLAISTSHGFSMLRGVAAWLLFGVLVIAILILLMVILGAAFLAVLASYFAKGAAAAPR